MPHLQEPHIVIDYDESIDAVEMNWQGFAEGDNFRDALNEGLTLVKDRDATNWLADLRDLGTVQQDDQRWSNDEWFPRALGAGIQNMALVQPESVVAEMSVDNIMEEVEDAGLVTHYFDNVADAREWLAERS